jgi:hypothetical protein
MLRFVAVPTTLLLQGAELDVIPDMIMEGSFKHVGRYTTQHSLFERMGHLFFLGCRKNQGERQNSVVVTCQLWSLSRVMNQDSIGFGSEPFGRSRYASEKKTFRIRIRAPPDPQ